MHLTISSAMRAMNSLPTRQSDNSASSSSSLSLVPRRLLDTSNSVHHLHQLDATTPTTSTPTTTRCEVCKGSGAFVEMVPCSHRFHARCVFGWPARHCCRCLQPVHRVRLLTDDKTLLQIKPKSTQQQQLQQLQEEQLSSFGAVSRKGKWSDDELRYANALMKLFQQGTLPLADGLHLRAFLAQLLLCDPLRVTKKYAGQSIGKQSFVYRPDASHGALTANVGGAARICFTSHVKVQKNLTNLRNHFYWNVQYRASGPSGNSCDEAIARLKQMETNYWIQQFHRFAMRIGQQVEFSNSWSANSVTPCTPLASVNSTPSALVPLSHPEKDSSGEQSETLTPLSPEGRNVEASCLESLPSDLLGNLADLEFFSVLEEEEPFSHDSTGMPMASSSSRHEQQHSALDALLFDDEPEQLTSSQWNWSNLS